MNQYIVIKKNFKQCYLCKDPHTWEGVSFTPPNTIYQRVQSKQHFLSQTIVGAIIGGVLGFTFYKYAKNQLQGPLKPKEEEYAPL